MDSFTPNFPMSDNDPIDHQERRLRNLGIILLLPMLGLCGYLLLNQSPLSTLSEPASLEKGIPAESGLSKEAFDTLQEDQLKTARGRSSETVRILGR